jgi:Mlc titration factor MtfA (ptsG expression regulator)
LSSLLHKGNFTAKPIVQPKLTINTPGDQYEQEADVMAERVMRMASNESEKPVTGLIGKSLQRKCAHCEEEEKRKMPVMRKTEAGNSGMSVSSLFASSLNASKGGGSPLPQRTKSFMENAFSADFSGVKIHTGIQASEMSKNINAKAFAYGNAIYFDEGAYNPDSKAGRNLLAHELTHTMQQTGAIQRSIATIPQPVRNKITLWDTVIAAATLSPTALNDYFRTTAPSSSVGFNGSIVIDSNVTTTGSIAPYDLSRGLNNIPGLIMSNHMPVNSTITLNMDLSRFGGQNGIFRFTYINTNTSTAATATPAYEFHIEFVAGVHTAAAQSARPATVTIGSNSFIAAGTWPDDRYDELVEVLGRLPASVQTQMNGVRIRYQTQIVQTAAQLGEDGEATIGTGIASSSRQIIIWSSVARPTIANYNGFSRTAFVVAHEIGHWLDFMPIANAFDAANTAGRSPAATDSLSGYYRMNTSGDFAEAANRPTAFQRLNAANTASTGYGATDLKESFAEYFALYVTEPTLLQQLRPAIHRFFSTTFP